MKSGGLKAAFERMGKGNEVLSNKECINLDSDSSGDTEMSTAP